MDTMRNRINYAWPVQTAAAPVLQYFIDEIENNRKYLLDKRIVIFGAGIRGNLLLKLLEERGFKDIIFSDNNPQKWNGRINQYDIISPDETRDFKGEQVYLLPSENGAAIRDQLLSWGGVNLSKINLFYWNLPLYDDYMREFNRSINNYALIMGDCAFSHISLLDDNSDSLDMMLKAKYGEQNVKILGMHGMGLRAYYNIINTLLNRGERPRKLIQMVNFDTLTSKHHIMPRAQHVELINRIYEANPAPEAEFKEYRFLAKERFDRFQTELYTEYKGSDSDNNDKLFMKMNYMYKLKDNTEGLQYLKRLLEQMNNMGIAVTLYIPPVNYMHGEKLWGRSFLDDYSANLGRLEEFLSGYDYSIQNASFLLHENEFAAITSIEETANYQGRLKLIDFFHSDAMLGK